MTTHFFPTQTDNGLYKVSKNGTMVGYAWTSDAGGNKVTCYLVAANTTIPDTASFSLDLDSSAPAFNSSKDFEAWVGKQPGGSNYTDKIQETSSYGTW